MTRAIPVLIDRSGAVAASLGGGLRSAVEEAFAPMGRPIALDLLRTDEIAAAAGQHAGKPLVVVGGGDRAIGAAAFALAHTSSALGILPFGTRNDLARQLGVPEDVAEAARLIGSGQRRRIDLGVAGERIFVSEAAFGIYTRLLREPGSRKGANWLRRLPVIWHVLRNIRSQVLSVSIDGAARELATPLLSIGNHPCAGDLGLLDDPENAGEGELSVFAVSAGSPRRTVASAVRALLGRADPGPDFEACEAAREVVIEGQGLIEGAFDGHLETIPLPVILRVLPNALGVVTPRETVVDSRALSRARTL